jgi:hypothetical protein
MKLAALGVVTAGLGVALDIPGLLGIGALWVLMGLVARTQKDSLGQLRSRSAAHPTAPAGTEADAAPVVDGRTFARGTLLWLAIGLPSLAVGVFRIGIDAEDADWRWLPVAVGGLALTVAVLGAVLYLTGSAALAAAERIGVPEVPATLWIRSVTETGSYVNERPRLEFDFRVEPDPGTGIASYEVTKKATVPFTAMASLRVGDGFKGRVVGPDKPTSMSIDWDSPVPGATSAASEPAPDVSARLDELDRLLRDARITDDEYQAQRQRILGSL